MNLAVDASRRERGDKVCMQVGGGKLFSSLTLGQFEIQLGELLPHVLRELADVDVVLGHR